MPTEPAATVEPTGAASVARLSSPSASVPMRDAEAHGARAGFPCPVVSGSASSSPKMPVQGARTLTEIQAPDSGLHLLLQP